SSWSPSRAARTTSAGPDEVKTALTARSRTRCPGKGVRMNPTPDIPISSLRASLNGSVIAPDDPGYDDARRVFFTGFDRRPAAVVRVADASDVSRTVNLARETGAELAGRGGGHSRAGFGTSEGGIVLDLSEMNAVEIDPGGRTAWAQAGITAGGYTRAAGEHGLATGLGDTASAGVGGITLGGGTGFLVREHGLTIDDVLGAEVVTAGGGLLEADEDTHPGLFRALRGGGGNFGVAARLRFRLHEAGEAAGGMPMLPASAEVIAGPAAAAEAAPGELSVIANVMRAPPLPFVPAGQHGRPVVTARMVCAGMPRPASGRSRPSARSRRRSPAGSARSATRRFTGRARGRRSTGGRTCSSTAWPPGAGRR